MASPNSKLAVVSALCCNLLLTVGKFVVFAITGSGAMLSEAIHSLADSLNQALLLVGVVLSSRQADEAYDYGYGAERSVWALMSAVGIFFLGCGVTVYHGVSSLLAGHHPEGNLAWAIGVLTLSLLLEGAVLVVAARQVKTGAAGKPFFDYLRTEADPSVAAVLLEDAAACLGVVIALTAIVLTQVTGKAYYDALGSLLVGLLLGVVAVWLIIRNRGLLVGPSIPPHIRKQVLRILHDDPAVEEVIDFRTRIIDTETYRITAELRFDGAVIAEKLRDKLAERYGKITNVDDFHRFAAEYADEVIELVGDEIDAIEKKIRAKVPKARYLDLEVD